MTVLGTSFVDMSLSSLVGISTGALCPGLTTFAGLINGVVFSIFFSNFRIGVEKALSRNLLDEEKIQVAVLSSIASTLTTAAFFWVFGRTFHVIALSLLIITLVGAAHLFKDKLDHANAVFRR